MKYEDYKNRVITANSIADIEKKQRLPDIIRLLEGLIPTKTSDVAEELIIENCADYKIQDIRIHGHHIQDEETHEINVVTGNISLYINNKNWYNPETITRGKGISVNTSGGLYNDNDHFVTDFIPSKYRKSYYFNAMSSANELYGGMYDKDRKFLQKISTKNNKFTITNANTKYIRFALLNRYLTRECQLEFGTNATTYKEHQGTSHTLALGNMELLDDDYIYIDNGSWYKHQEWAKIDNYAGEEITTDYISSTGELSEGATVYYKEAAEMLIEDTTLIKQLNTLLNSSTYTGKTIMYSTNELSPSFQISYKENIDKRMSDSETAILSLGTNT